MGLSENDVKATIERYKERFGLYGYSPKTLGWFKGKQRLRFQMLTSFFPLQEHQSYLDVGCGFGDLNLILKEKGLPYSYLGVDLVEELIHFGNQMFNEPNIQFILGDFLKIEFQSSYDYVISSGMFNHKFEKTDNYQFIEKCMEKAFSLCNVAIAFDFLSDKVDYKHDHTFHSSPEKILSMAYRLSRNVVLRNDYMPFEFTVIVFKNDSFSKIDTIFNSFKERADER
ncbi:methyltransferase domain-containing protein [Cohnella sp. CFH 77786]|uniref:class I SAM-dependent methyltransferase n=1 Tax=Cohnella sp. CFH 77786 TaxID=2662265 RepID=UPI001C61103E|nr:class I SAM-dependent methyltransferase [Cohnella sp. CFH 77786]MBW5448460.1 methyltransferase domain-containing protein [Cohnella sp. CFH 77786]